MSIACLLRFLLNLINLEIICLRYRKTEQSVTGAWKVSFPHDSIIINTCRSIACGNNKITPMWWSHAGKILRVYVLVLLIVDESVIFIFPDWCSCTTSYYTKRKNHHLVIISGYHGDISWWNNHFMSASSKTIEMLRNSR